MTDRLPSHLDTTHILHILTGMSASRSGPSAGLLSQNTTEAIKGLDSLRSTMLATSVPPVRTTESMSIATQLSTDLSHPRLFLCQHTITPTDHRMRTTMRLRLPPIGCIVTTHLNVPQSIYQHCHLDLCSESPVSLRLTPTSRTNLRRRPALGASAVSISWLTKTAMILVLFLLATRSLRARLNASLLRRCFYITFLLGCANRFSDL